MLCQRGSLEHQTNTCQSPAAVAYYPPNMSLCPPPPPICSADDLCLQPKAVKAEPKEKETSPPEAPAEMPTSQSSEAQALEKRAAQEAEAVRTAETVAQELEAAKRLVGEAGAEQLREFMQKAAAFEAEQSRWACTISGQKYPACLLQVLGRGKGGGGATLPEFIQLAVTVELSRAEPVSWH